VSSRRGARATRTGPSVPGAEPAPLDAPGARMRRRRRSSACAGGNPLVYAVALVVVAITVGPVVFAALGGFRTNAQLAQNPVGMPDPRALSNYSDVITSGDF